MEEILKSLTNINYRETVPDFDLVIYYTNNLIPGKTAQKLDLTGEARIRGIVCAGTVTK